VLNAVLSVGTSPATPTQVAFSVQPSASTAGQALSPAIEVEVRDAAGNLVPTARNAVTLAISANPGGGTLAGTKTVTAVINAKKAINEGLDLPIEEGLKGETRLFSDLFKTQDMHEGVAAFLEKRKPKFTGK